MIRINLLGHEAEGQARGLKSLRLPELSMGVTQAGIAALFILVLSSVALAWWTQSRQLHNLRSELAVVQAERARLQDVADGVEQLRQRTDRLRQKLQVIVELKANQIGPVRLLDEVSRRLTDELWLTRLELDEGDVTIRGEALSEVNVADFVNNLEGSAYFQNVFLRTLGDSGEALSFQINLKFKPLQGQAVDGAASAGGAD